MLETQFTRATAVTSLCLLGLLTLGALAPTSAEESEGSPLEEAFAAIVNFEAVLNARDENGQYVAQIEGAESLAERLAPYMVDDFIGVTGVGHATDYLGYQPTSLDRVTYAQALIDAQAAGIFVDELAGAEQGTYDFLHMPFTGRASGKLAYFTLNFAGLGSFMDEEGNRLPVDFAAFDPDGEPAPVVGRCICVCAKVNGQWKLVSFYFVLTPPDELFEIA